MLIILVSKTNYCHHFKIFDLIYSYMRTVAYK
jgi:hypothetical protein